MTPRFACSLFAMLTPLACYSPAISPEPKDRPEVTGSSGDAEATASSTASAVDEGTDSPSSEGGGESSSGSGCEADGCAAGDDADDDGVADASDCDPADPQVGATWSRPCSSDCAQGVEICEQGAWLGCSAPTDCACDPGDETTAPEQREFACGNCGTQLQVCAPGGTWIDVGGCGDEGLCAPGQAENGGACGNLCGVQAHACDATCAWEPWTCEADGVCSPDEIENEDQPCGACGEAQSRSRSCADDCSWGAWGPWGECVAQGQCEPGELEEEQTSCGLCGSSTRFRTCDDDGCGFGEWSAWSACAAQGECAPGQLDQQDQGCGSCDGSQSRTRSCSDSCYWGGWAAWSSCAECTDPQLPICNANKGTCECNDASCDSGVCCDIAPNYASGSYCGNNGGGVACLFGFFSCTSDAQCASGYWCCDNGTYTDCVPDWQPSCPE